MHDFGYVGFWPRVGATLKHATPGRMAMAAILVDATTGGTPGVGRHFAYLLTGLPLGLGFLSVAFNRPQAEWARQLAGMVLLRHGAALHSGRHHRADVGMG